MDWVVIRQSLGPSLRGFTDRAVKVMAAARREAAKHRHPNVTAEHVLLGLGKVERGSGRETLERLGVNLEERAEGVTDLLAGIPAQSAGKKVAPSPRAGAPLARAPEPARAPRHH